jgi:hypothetical protein
MAKSIRAEERKENRVEEKRHIEANEFAIRLAEGMVGWTTFAQAGHLSAIYSEYLTYLPIFQIAKGRGWRVFSQKKLRKAQSARGRFRTVDFVFRSNELGVGIFCEVKFARSTATHCLQISKDIRKLFTLGPADVSKKDPPRSVYKYILVLGKEKTIKDRVGKKAKTIGELDIGKLARFEDSRLQKQVQAAFDAKRDRNPELSKRAWAFPGAGDRGWRYWAVLLTWDEWWASLATLPANMPASEDELDDEEAESEESDWLEKESSDDSETLGSAS